MIVLYGWSATSVSQSHSYKLRSSWSAFGLREGARSASWSRAWLRAGATARSHSKFGSGLQKVSESQTESQALDKISKGLRA